MILIDAKELQEAIGYFTCAEKYGYSNGLDDWTAEEIIKNYRWCLAHENLDQEDPIDPAGGETGLDLAQYDLDAGSPFHTLG